ncbi:RNA-directed DNA polymerase, eukaryota, reverse transcriptase zinc-binding domain protein [Tanacetum coccineum]
MLSKWWWRFRTEENALWCKVICSIHGPSGGMYHSSSRPLSSGTWSRICNLKNDLRNFGIELPRLFKKKAGNGRNTSFWHDNWIGGATLQDSFYFVFHSSTVPEPSLVLGQNQQPTTLPFGLTFNWAWLRPPRSQADQNELAELTNLLSDLHLTNTPDTWEFIEDSSRNFTVKSMRNHINHMSNPSTFQPIRWNKFLSAKVNILVWRIMNKRVPTWINLDKRGIDRDSVRCPLFDDDIETEDHLFALCSIAKDVWKEVMAWWKISSVLVTSVTITGGLNLALDLNNLLSFDDAPVLDEIDDLETGEKREGDKTVDDNNEGDSVLENEGIKSFSYSGNVFESLMRLNI